MKQYVRKCLFGFLIVFMGLALGAQAQAQETKQSLTMAAPISTEEFHSPPAIVEAMSRRVKLITTICTSDGAKWGPFYASGTILSTGWVLSNAHNVRAEGIQQAMSDGEVTLLKEPSSEKIKAPVVTVTSITAVFENNIAANVTVSAYVGPPDDLSLLKVQTPVKEMIPLYQFAPAVGQEVLFAGLPGTDAMIAHGWIVGVRPGTLISSIFPVGGGMSGGSLYTPDGRLYGVQARWKPATGASFSTSNGRIGQFLRDTYEIHKLPLPWQVMALTPNKTIDAPKEAVVATCNPPVQIVK